MRHMRIGEKQIVVADLGQAAMLARAGVHGHAFADRAVRADAQLGIHRAVMHALRIAADHRIREDARAHADGGAAGDHHMAEENHIVSQHHLRPDMAEGADGDVLADHGALSTSASGWILALAAIMIRRLPS